MICYRKKNKLLTSIILRILPQDPKIRRNPLSIKFFQVISPLDIVNYPYYNFTITRYNQFAWRKSRYQYPNGSDQISKVEENFPDIEEISWLISTRREERIHFCEISFFIKYQSVKFRGYLPRNPVELLYSHHDRFSYFN